MSLVSYSSIWQAWCCRVCDRVCTAVHAILNHFVSFNDCRCIYLSCWSRIYRRIWALVNISVCCRCRTYPSAMCSNLLCVIFYRAAHTQYLFVWPQPNVVPACIYGAEQDIFIHQRQFSLFRGVEVVVPSVQWCIRTSLCAIYFGWYHNVHCVLRTWKVFKKCRIIVVNIVQMHIYMCRQYFVVPLSSLEVYDETYQVLWRNIAIDVTALIFTLEIWFNGAESTYLWCWTRIWN